MFLGQPLLERILHRVGVEPEAGDLLRDRAHVVRMGVSDGDHGVSAVEVEVLGPGGVVNEAAPAAHRLHRIEWIYIEEFHLFPVFRLSVRVRQKAEAFRRSPSFSSRPNIRFMFCTAWPEAPFSRLSITETTCTLSP